MSVAAHRQLVTHVKPVDPQQLIADKIQPGHPLFGVVWINPERVSGSCAVHVIKPDGKIVSFGPQ